MFDIFFGWRKASKCKRVIKRVQCRLKMLKSKRTSIVRQLREDLAQLIKTGREESAFNRAEQLFKDESIMAVYELLDNFCEFITTNLSYIRRHKDCPNDINEAVSSLIFASARCGDLPELRVIRKLFGERYGQRFAMAAVELFPGNLVNRQIKEKLSINSVPDDVKYKLVDEIARDCCLQPEILAIEYTSELQQVKEHGSHQSPDADVYTHCSRNEGSPMQPEILAIEYTSELQQVKEHDTHQSPDAKAYTHYSRNEESPMQPEILAIQYTSELQQVKEHGTHQSPDADVYTHYSRNEGSLMQASNVNNTEVEPIYVDLSSTNRNLLTRPYHSHSHWNSETVSTSISSSIVQQSSPDTFESPMNELTFAGLNTKETQGSGKTLNTTLKHMKARTVAASSSESFPQVSEDTIVYLDDIEESRSSITEDGDCQDQRLIKFISSIMPKREKFKVSCDESCIDQYEVSSEKSGSRSCQKSIKASGKRSRRRSVSQEDSSMKDVEFVLYYDKPHKSSRSHKHISHHHRKHQKKTPVGESEQSYHEQNALKQPNRMGSCCNRSFNHGMNVCSLEHPCYFYTGDGKDDLEVSHWNQKKGNRTLVGCPNHDLKCENLRSDFGHCHCFQDGKSDKEVVWATLPQRPTGKSNENGATLYHVFTYTDCRPYEQHKKNEGKVKGSNSPGSCASSNGLHPKVTSSWTGKETLPPYLRAMTMPPERPKDNHTNSILRTNSSPFQHPNHVHPKLPDYDDIAAKFMALKKDHLHNKCH